MERFAASSPAALRQLLCHLEHLGAPGAKRKPTYDEYVSHVQTKIKDMYDNMDKNAQNDIPQVIRLLCDAVKNMPNDLNRNCFDAPVSQELNDLLAYAEAGYQT
jgi:hypothetical protein